MITVVVIVVLVVAAAALFFVGRGRARGGGGRELKRRFGPEYDRVVAHHEGDARAAERELGARVKRHGSLKEQPLSPEAREHYLAQWTAVQEQFVESPQKAVIEADALLSRLARDRGFPDGEQFEEQLAALSVHHAHYVHGYRSLHTAARSQNGTEKMREAMIEARSLFEALVTEQPADPDRLRPQSPDARGHTPWTLSRRHAKGSGTRR
ncbi:hypothetical protein [Streptomyces lasiicapitis]|uniref:Secreted protein n=1 Tax=Streptomyces lasiicapitis TaxID=1923961 RepID=A0ABQ2M0L7_9ACTN|nr:hypothetical protein [Streptomyces lasiicapitis]GGO45704.1 hypothetical protein GCM10012286_34910 [Streptomyces lasiicapitis]